MSRKRVARTLGITILVLLLLNIAVNALHIVTGHGNIYGLVPMFDFFEEMNVPTLFSTLLLVGTSALLYFTHVLSKCRPGGPTRHWAILSWIFLFLAIDEFTELHEKLSRPTQRISGILPGSFEYWGWVVPYAVLVVLTVAYFATFFLKLARRFQVFFGIAAIMYVGGAIGCEVLEGLYLSTSRMSLEVTRIQVPYVILVSLEETLEMGGVAVLFCSLLEYIEGISAEHVFGLKS